MKLNGWERLGIVASVVWILGAGLYTCITETHSEVQDAHFTVSCGEMLHPGEISPECEKDGRDYLDKLRGEPEIDAAFVAFLPLPIAWGLVYLTLFTARWFRRGFDDQETLDLLISRRRIRGRIGKR